tara:strand:- start:7893 stop:8897 length:1005 start_codon:yes stop_codon:yes gene_type:complete
MIKHITFFLIFLLGFPKVVNAQEGRRGNTNWLTNLSFRHSSTGKFYSGIKPIDAVSIKRNGKEYLIAIFQDFDEDSYNSVMVLSVYEKINNKWNNLLQWEGGDESEYLNPEYLEGTLELHFNGSQVFFEIEYGKGGTIPYLDMAFILFDYLENKFLGVHYGNWMNDDVKPKSKNAIGLPKGGDIEVEYTYDGVSREMIDFIKMKIATSGNITEPFYTQNDKENAGKSFWSYYENLYKEQDEEETKYKKQETIKSATEGINVDEINLGMSIKQVKDIINVSMKLETKSSVSTVYKVVNFEGNNSEVYFLYFDRYGKLEEINTGELPADIQIEIKN